MPLPTSAWDGGSTAPNICHVALKGSNDDGSLSFGELAGGTATDYALSGFLEVVSKGFSIEVQKRTAMNSRSAIKNVSGDSDLSFDVTAMVPTAWNLSAAYGRLGNYTTRTVFSGTPGSMYVDAIIFYLTDGEISGTTCAYTHAIHMARCLVTPMLGNDTIDGKGTETLRFKLTPENDDTYGLFEFLPEGTIDVSGNTLPALT